MATGSVSVQCSVAGQDAEITVNLKNDNSWSTSPGAWMSVKSGKWIQAANAGVRLQDATGDTKVAYLKGLIFAQAKPSSGQFLYEAGGDAGTWRIR
ncbi:hypothetical protein PCA31118_04499 [Pandoraea captiosa]|uniref:Uncharacterized protein n=1 Tax=Pandoraea captiosa TaxID=2508302 RepID=A0A5E5AHX7_9BURK|nr:hypothetical protein [Pandoraea captiosa]VVE73321.1 hypothetical protein PCA31118_04499 [Pandoraea captiosa]